MADKIESKLRTDLVKLLCKIEPIGFADVRTKAKLYDISIPSHFTTAGSSESFWTDFISECEKQSTSNDNKLIRFIENTSEEDNENKAEWDTIKGALIPEIIRDKKIEQIKDDLQHNSKYVVLFLGTNFLKFKDSEKTFNSALAEHFHKLLNEEISRTKVKIKISPDLSSNLYYTAQKLSLTERYNNKNSNYRLTSNAYKFYEDNKANLDASVYEKIAQIPFAKTINFNYDDFIEDFNPEIVSYSTEKDFLGKDTLLKEKVISQKRFNLNFFGKLSDKEVASRASFEGAVLTENTLVDLITSVINEK